MEVKASRMEGKDGEKEEEDGQGERGEEGPLGHEEQGRGISGWVEVGRPLPRRRNSTGKHPKIFLKVGLLGRTPWLHQPHLNPRSMRLGQWLPSGCNCFPGSGLRERWNAEDKTLTSAPEDPSCHCGGGSKSG